MINEQLVDLERFTEIEKQIIAFVQKYPRVVINMPLDELARECFVSQASVIRLCKKLGVKGFADFKVNLASELTAFATDNRTIPLDIPIPPDSSERDIAKIFYNLSRQTLDSTHNALDFAALHKAAGMFDMADLIHLYGRGESLIIAEDFHYKLLRIGISSQLEDLNGFQEARSRHPNHRLRECGFVISQYCNSRQVHFIIDEMVSANIPFVLLTAAAKCWPYDKYAAVTLRYPCAESRYKMGSFASRTSALYITDCLYGLLFSRHYDRNRHNLEAFSRRKVERDYYYTFMQETPDGET